MKGEIPNLFDNFLMDVPSEINLPELSSNFSPINHKTVIIASKILFNKEDAGFKRDSRKLFQQVIFSDEETISKLDGQMFHLHGEKTSVDDNIGYSSQASVIEASRASISDPFYMEPATINGHKYVTDAIDLYPLEIAKKLGDEVIFIYPTKFDVIEQGAIYSTFNFSHNKRHDQVFSNEIDYLVDYTDFPSELKFTPKPDFLAWEIKSRLPDTYQEYREIVRRQFNYGYRRMLEAAKNKGSIKHIRNL